MPAHYGARRILDCIPPVITAEFPLPAPSMAIPASTLLEGFESLTGFSSPSAQASLALDTVNKKEGASALSMSQSMSTTGDAISTKTLTGIDAQNLGILSATIYAADCTTTASATVTLTKDSVAMTGGQIALGSDTDMPLWRTVMLDTADVAGKPAGVGSATLQLRQAARTPTGAQVVFDSVYANDQDIPAIIVVCDDGTSAMLSEGAVYARSQGVALNFAIPVDGANRASWNTIRSAETIGHGICPNFTSKDDGPTAAVTRQNFVNDALYSKNTLLAQGISPRQLGVAIASNGALDLNSQYPPLRLTDVVYDGNGGATFTTAPASPPAIGMIYKGWDYTLGRFVTTVITDAPSATSFKTAYPFPANSAGGAVAKRGYYRLDGEFLDRKLGNDLKAAGFKLGLRTSTPSDVKISTKRGLIDFFQPRQGFTNPAPTNPTTLAAFEASMKQAQKYGCSIIWYLHTWVADTTADNDVGIGHRASLLKSVFDMLGAQQKANALWGGARIDRWMARMGMNAGFGS